MTRPKELMDNAVPSGNSLAAVGLLRLGALTGDESLRDRAEAIVRLLGEPAGRVPMAFGNLLLADRAAGARHHRGRRHRRPP